MTTPIAFTFGEPVAIHDREIFDYVECWHNGRWYEPPVNLHGLSKAYKSTPYLSSGIIFKRNFLANLFIPHAKLSRKAFEQIALDFIWCGNAYLEEIRSVRGGVLRYQPSLAKYTRAGKNGKFFMLYDDELGYQEHKFSSRIRHIKECDINQEIYGSPEYYAALQSAWLNESATLFRRKYYNNGSHAGFILYVNDPANDPNDIDALRQALKDSKGPGNFRNCFSTRQTAKKTAFKLSQCRKSPPKTTSARSRTSVVTMCCQRYAFHRSYWVSYRPTLAVLAQSAMHLRCFGEMKFCHYKLG